MLVVLKFFTSAGVAALEALEGLFLKGPGDFVSAEAKANNVKT